MPRRPTKPVELPPRSTPPEACIQKAVFVALLGVPEATFDDARKNDLDFPKPVHPTPRKPCWIYGEVLNYLRLLAERRGQGAA